MRKLAISQSITNRDATSLDKYLQEISKVEMVSPEEEVMLAGRIRKGDRQALDRLTRANLRFVVSVAKQYQGFGLPLSDLINEGNVGLIKAAERFDDTRGFKFISFAVWWIRQSILQALAENARLIRLPMNKVALGHRIARVHAQLEQQLERMPTAEELADILGLEEEEVKQSLYSSQMPVSLDSPLGDDEDGGSLLDTVEDRNAEGSNTAVEHDESLRTELERSMRILNPKQRETICCFFGIGVDYPMTLEDIAQKFNLTLERVRQIKERALDKLRTAQHFDRLRAFLG